MVVIITIGVVVSYYWRRSGCSCSSRSRYPVFLPPIVTVVVVVVVVVVVIVVVDLVVTVVFMLSKLFFPYVSSLSVVPSAVVV